MGRRRRRPLAPEIQPVDVDGVQAVAIGTLLWSVAFVVLLFVRSDLQAAGREWWLWTSLAGAGLGLLGLEYCRRRRDRLNELRREEQSAPARPAPTADADDTEPYQAAAIPAPRNRPGRRRAASR